LLGSSNKTVRREYIFEPTTGNESLNGISNVNAVTAINLATSKNLNVKGESRQGL
jgi:hypothetical protein